MKRVVDTLNQSVAEGGLWVTLRADSAGGVSLGGNASIEPGETKKLPAAIALRLLQSGRAVRAEPAKAVPVPVPDAPPADPPTAATTSTAAPIVAPAKPPKRGRK